MTLPLQSANRWTFKGAARRAVRWHERLIVYTDPHPPASAGPIG